MIQRLVTLLLLVAGLLLLWLATKTSLDATTRTLFAGVGLLSLLLGLLRVWWILRDPPRRPRRFSRQDQQGQPVLGIARSAGSPYVPFAQPDGHHQLHRLWQDGRDLRITPVASTALTVPIEHVAVASTEHGDRVFVAGGNRVFLAPAAPSAPFVELTFATAQPGEAIEQVVAMAAIENVLFLLGRRGATHDLHAWNGSGELVRIAVDLGSSVEPVRIHPTRRAGVPIVLTLLAKEGTCHLRGFSVSGSPKLRHDAARIRDVMTTASGLVVFRTSAGVGALRACAIPVHADAVVELGRDILPVVVAPHDILVTKEAGDGVVVDRVDATGALHTLAFHQATPASGVYGIAVSGSAVHVLSNHGSVDAWVRDGELLRANGTMPRPNTDIATLAATPTVLCFATTSFLHVATGGRLTAVTDRGELEKGSTIRQLLAVGDFFVFEAGREGQPSDLYFLEAGVGSTKTGRSPK